MTQTEQQAQSNPEQPQAKGGKKMIWIAGLVILAIVVFMYARNPERFGGQQAGSGQVVATVGDREITREELDEQVAQLTAAQQIPSATGEEQQVLERQILDQMIEEQLFYADAQAKGISVAPNEIEEQYNTIVTEFGGQEAVEEALAGAGLTVDKFRESLERQLVLEAYFEQLKEERDISVSDEEVRAFYDEQIAGQETEIPFEAVEAQVRAELEQQQLSQIIPQILEELKAQADIQVNI
ncbi:MAG: SurA N-terminal domain-containing protein [Candidatus Andersenbacteria bacterium]